MPHIKRKNRFETPEWALQLLEEFAKLKKDVHWMRYTVYFIVLPLLLAILAQVLSS